MERHDQQTKADTVVGINRSRKAEGSHNLVVRVEEASPQLRRVLQLTGK